MFTALGLKTLLFPPARVPHNLLVEELCNDCLCLGCHEYRFWAASSGSSGSGAMLPLSCCPPNSIYLLLVGGFKNMFFP